MTDDAETAVEGSVSLSEGLPDPEGHGGSKLHQEAARYRLRAKEAESSLQSAQQRIEALQTAELHRLAAEYLANGHDIDLSGKQLSDFTTPEGWVDRQAVKEAAQAVLAERPRLGRLQPARDPSQGFGGQPANVDKPSWGSLFRN